MVMRASVGILLILLSWCCSPTSSLEQLKNDLIEVMDEEAGTFALAFHDLPSGQKILINADERFHAASTMKTPVMIEVFKQAEAGLFLLEDSLVVKNSFYSIVDSSLYSLTVDSDSESELYDQVGSRRSIYDLVYDMIIVSSNLATNQVIDLVDARKVTATMRSLGADSIEVLRGVEDLKAFEAGLSNSTTAMDLAVMYEQMARGSIVSPEVSQAMIDILLDQRFNEIIPAHLPDGVKVAHKTGAITGVHHDSGIVFLPDGRKYVLVILSKELEDFDQGTAMMARLSKMIYDFVDGR